MLRIVVHFVTTAREPGICALETLLLTAATITELHWDLQQRLLLQIGHVVKPTMPPPLPHPPTVLKPERCGS